MHFLLLYQYTTHWLHYDADFLYNCWFLFIIIMELRCKYAPFWQEFIVKSLMLRWTLRPVGLLFKKQLLAMDNTKYFLPFFNDKMHADEPKWIVMNLYVQQKKCDGTKILKKFETFSGFRIDPSTQRFKKCQLYLILILPYVQCECMFCSCHSWVKE